MSYNAFNHKEWDDAGLKDFSDFSELVDYVNQEEFGDSARGEWFYGDDENRTLYWGTFADDHSPGASQYTSAEIFETDEEYKAKLAEWEALPEYVEEEITKYDSLRQCIDSGDHLNDCDDDGYCNHCGHQDEVD